MTVFRRLIPVVVLCAVVTTSVTAEQARTEPATIVIVDPDKPDQAILERDFSKKMSGATLVGSFTIDGKNAGKPPKPERYELGVVKKLKSGSWLWVARIKYGGRDFKIPVPITLTMKWAGDTPVITMTNLKIPTMGTFTARVLFYGDRYVGTWQHGKVGGHMFGKIEPAKKKDKAKPKAAGK